MTDERRSDEAVAGEAVAGEASVRGEPAAAEETRVEGRAGAGAPESAAAGAGTEAMDAQGTRGGESDAGAEESAVAVAAAAQVESLRAELDALNDRHLRLAAEFDNYRKRSERERAEQWTRAQAELVGKLLDVLDDLQRVAAVEVEQATAASLLEGVELVEKKFRHALEAAGLEPIQAEGEFFNPSVMEALMTVPADAEEEDEMVADVFQKGYRFKEHLIRPARVRVKQYEA